MILVAYRKHCGCLSFGSDHSLHKDSIMNTAKTALVTGANRGIGRAIAMRLAAEGFHVIAAARNTASLQELVVAVEAAGGKAQALALDVGDVDSIARASQTVAQQHPKLDVLVNNAGINVGFADTIFAASAADVASSIQINAMGPLQLTKSLLPLLRAAGHAHVVNVSSEAGSISDTVNPASPYAFMEGGAYRLSKTMLNGLTGLMAKALRADGISVNAMCPGWTRTDMGGSDAPRTPEQAAALALRLATLPPLGSAGSATGGFFNEAGALAW
jgi:NAD(P)-dependent dehydrogenase (short-subunit alcohol dehydrogenase family)